MMPRRLVRTTLLSGLLVLLAAPIVVDTKVARYAEQPGVQARLTAKGAERGIHTDEYLLRDVLGVLVAVDHP